MVKKVLDPEIRKEFIKRNLSYFSKDNTYFINEMKLNSKNIIDMIYFDFNNNNIIGFEIKGSQDTLKRLEKQLKTYVTFCNMVYVVVHCKLTEKVFDMLRKKSIFSKIGVIEVDDNLNFKELKKAEYRKPFFDSFIRNLDTEELISLSEGKNISTTHFNKDSIVSKLKRHITWDEVYNSLKNKVFKYYIKGEVCCDVKITYNKYVGEHIDRYCMLCNRLVG